MPSFGQRLTARYDADMLYKDALAAYMKNNPKGAIEKLNESIRLLPSNAEYWAARGLMYYELGADDLAQADFERALRSFQGEVLAHYGLGLVALRDGRADDALKHFDAAYRLDPQRGETLYAMALAHDKAGHALDAVAWMERAYDRFDATGDKHKADAQRHLTTLRRKAR